jgi:tetratricopeptide (TPR) repeat protein
MSSGRIITSCCLLASTLYGCSGGGAALLHSDTQALAGTHLERGLRAQYKGETLLAEKHLSDALKTSSSIEDNPGRLIALVNLARLNRLNNKPETAAAYIDQALKLAQNIPGFMAEPAYEKALIELTQKRHEEALKWAMLSLSSGNGESKGRTLNLVARIHHAAGNKTEVASSALKALEENRSNGQSDEEANSLRLLGTLKRENGSFDEAGKFLLESLEIDKRNGESAKISLGLEELAALAGDRGDMKMMLEYLERAYSVHLSGARIGKAASTQLIMAEILRKAGNVTQAEKAMQTAQQLMQMNQLKFSESAKPSNKP